jgi:20S proteasome subunit alpha 7
MFLLIIFVKPRTAVGIVCKDGVVLAVEKVVTSRLYESGVNKRLFIIDQHIGMTIAGLLADARSLVNVAREEAKNYRSNYGTNIPLKVCLKFYFLSSLQIDKKRTKN